MLAAVFAREGTLEMQERPVPAISHPSDVLLDVEGCGICGTDLHILESPPGHPATPGCILGHEYIGRIVETGRDVTSLRPGERVAVAPNISCGVCRACQAGRPNHCIRFTTLGIFRDGGLARYNVAPERACHLLSPALPFEDAVWTEVLSCVANSVDNVKPQPGETAVVIGGGPVGALHALLFRAAGAQAIVTDVAEARLKALSHAGIDHVVNGATQRVPDAVRSICPEGADIVVDAVGTQLDAALDLVRTGGRISLFGMNSRAKPAVRQNAITRNELTIFGSYVGVNMFPRAIGLLESGVIHPSVLLSDILPLNELPAALELLRTGDAMKIAIRHS
ncbi:MAG: alcohol dehydrogenase catalytic domain-containing protein [Acidobacteriota bacterium]